MTDELTREEIRQLRAIIAHRVRWEDEGERAFVERAVLALTEPPPTVDVTDLAEACDEYRAAYWAREDRTPGLVDDLAVPIARLRRVLALTEQPEPVAPPLNEDPVAVALNLAEPLNAEIAARAKAIKKRVAILRLERELREQPEPVSRDDIADALWERGALPLSGNQAAALADALLSRYTITRKQPEGADR